MMKRMGKERIVEKGTVWLKRFFHKTQTQTVDIGPFVLLQSSAGQKVLTSLSLELMFYFFLII